MKNRESLLNEELTMLKGKDYIYLRARMAICSWR